MAEHPLSELASRVGEILSQRGETLVTAESCTGGGIAAAVTDMPGSSGWFERGFVTYSNASKTELLGVSERTLREKGAVSEAVVAEMAAGALAHSRADLAVAASGIAGPDGGTPEKPVGTVCLAWQRRGGPVRVRTVHLTGSRGEIRSATVRLALEGIEDRGQTSILKIEV